MIELVNVVCVCVCVCVCGFCNSKRHVGAELVNGVCVCVCVVFATPRGMWELSSPTGDVTHAPCSGSMEF